MNEYFIKYPWLKSFYAARQRVSGKNPKHYLYQGLEFSITKEEIKALWIRDNAKSMKTPSIDRIKNNIGYTNENCRFIEKSLNTGRSLRERTKCLRGHNFTEENIWRDKYGSRRCNQCRRDNDNKRYKSKKVLAGLDKEDTK